jgi:predicted RNase H-like HicB family nuclease
MLHKADPDETGYWAECPSLGCVTQGETIQETLANMRELIDLWIESLEENNEPIPQESSAY